MKSKDKISFAGKPKTVAITIPPEILEDLMSICGEESIQTFTKKLWVHWLKKVFPDKYDQVVWDFDIEEFRNERN
jgi:hypothetical protein